MLRRTLEVHFAREMGCSPFQELRRCRLKHSQSLLLETDLSIRDIAQHCGFQYVENFHAVFRREHQVTPTEFRQRTR